MHAAATMILIFLLVTGAAAQTCSGPFGQPVPDCCACTQQSLTSACSNPCTQFCGCQCPAGTVGYSGGNAFACLSQPAGVDPCGYNGNVPGTSGYSTTNSECQCPQRCNFDARTTLCSGHGVSPADYTLHEANKIPYPEMDCFPGAGVNCVANRNSLFAGTWGSSTLGYCLCDPGYYGQTLTAQTDPSTGQVYHVVANCARQVSVDFCSSAGRDSTGPPIGAETCMATPGPPLKFSPTNGPLGENFQNCGRRYVSSMAKDTSSFTQPPKCLCNPGIIGGSGTSQCSQTIRALTCSGHGQDQCLACRYTADATTAPACQCDVGWGPSLPSGGGIQCGSFVSCSVYGCGTPPSPVSGYVPTLGGTCNTGDQSCTCHQGYGGIACCPLQFQNATIVCNGVGSCTTNGYCSCPGWQLPGCCPQCDSSQTCLIDGRCDCPVLGGIKCGGFGTGCVSGGFVNIGTHRQALLACQFQNALVQPRTGVFFSVPITGQFGCPPCGSGGACTSNAHPLDYNSTVTGSCVCAQDLPQGYNRTGSYCCPTAAGQNAPCSGGVNGYCNPLTATCVCDPGVLGLACETNTQCNPSLSSQCTGPGGQCPSGTECSGNGQCTHNVAGSFGLGDYLAQLNYGTGCISPYTTKDRVQIADCSLVVFLKAVYAAFFALDPTAVPGGVPESNYYPVSVCNTGVTRGQCLFALLVAMQSLPAGTPVSNTLCSQMQQDPLYVVHAFNRINPTRQLLTGNYFNQLSSAFTCSSNTTTLATGMASLLAWEMWNKLYRDTKEGPPDTTRFTMNPGLPLTNPGSEWQCQCAAGGIGGVQCEQTGCPVGSNGVACSGFVNGQFQGLCTGSNQCECSAAWGCQACDCPKSPGCFPLGASGQVLCSTNGNCLLNSTSRSFQCQCQPQFTGTYCDLSRCQPPGNE